MNRLDSEEAWQLVKETFNAVRQSMPLRTPSIESWIEAMIMGYEVREEHEDAWYLTQETFNDLCECNPIHSEPVTPWVERMLLGYEARWEHEEAWQLTEQMFKAVLEVHGKLTAPAIGPWIERMILGHETRGQHEEARQLIEQLYVAYTDHRLPFTELGGMGVLFRLLCAYQSSRWLADDQLLLNIISRQERLDLLNSDKLSLSCRSLLSRSLRCDRNGCTLISLRLGEGSGELRVHSDVLCYWSKYFERALSGRWPFPDSFDVNPDNEFNLLSLTKIFDDFVYSGTYNSESSEERMTEKVIAEYFQIDYLIGILQ
ncbi:hypothetical protein Forpe1208_v017019 [Fusarium oxysporum f. sp. rapae]|uniref:BTB domain-containing protein n=1 Tax=Fusarium oxysporum f. sp. rapae TaxID=485398 RepID=A0A8J5NDK6_FUSOX|nr:hypothetical protein Forpe1208_v017019 [Fusarium oxysporum f. sp. rapae]